MCMYTYSRALAFLDARCNNERLIAYSYKAFRLTRVKELFQALNIAHSQLKIIHVAGTKGKGSTSAYAAHMLASNGYRTGLYTSPHVRDIRERIQVLEGNRPRMERQEKEINKKAFAKIVQSIQPGLKKFKKESGYAPSYFEIITAVALIHFLEKQCSYVVLETGLGGRLDATNAVMPAVSVITHIGFDHMDKLGNTLPKIAYEKAGIIKNHVPCVCAPQQKSVLDVIEKKARSKHAPLFVLGKNVRACGVRMRNQKTVFNLEHNGNEYSNIHISMRGAAQVENASLAAAAVASIAPEADISKGAAEVCLEGRFQEVRANPLIVVDAAHNEDSFRVLAENLHRYYPGKKIILLFSCSRDKNPGAMIRCIPYHRLILTACDNSRMYTPWEIARICGLSEAVCIARSRQAYKAALKAYTHDACIVIAGSFFLAGEVLRYIEKKRI